MSEDNSEYELETEYRSSYRSKHLETIEDRPKRDLSNCYVEPPSEGNWLKNALYVEFLQSIDSDLPDHRIATLSQAAQQASYREIESLRKQMHDYMGNAAERNKRDFILNNPKAAGLDYSFTGRVVDTKYSSINYKLVLLHMLDCMLQDHESFTTMTAILESAKQSTGIQVLNAKIWQMKLARYMFKALVERTSKLGYPISFVGCTCMRDVKKAIDAYFVTDSAIVKLHPKVALSKDKITIDKNTFAIAERTKGDPASRSIRLIVNGRRQSMRIDALLVALGQ